MAMIYWVGTIANRYSAIQFLFIRPSGLDPFKVLPDFEICIQLCYFSIWVCKPNPEDRINRKLEDQIINHRTEKK